MVEKQIIQKGDFSPIRATLWTGQPAEAVVPATTGGAGEFLRAHLRTLAATGQYKAIGMASKVEANVAESKTSVSGILYQFNNAGGVSQATFLPYTVDAVGNMKRSYSGAVLDFGVAPILPHPVK